MTVDFTEAAGAGSVAGWKTAAYAPIFHLEPLERKSQEFGGRLNKTHWILLHCSIPFARCYDIDMF